MGEVATNAPRQWFRFAGLLACGMVTLPILVDQWFSRSTHLQVPGPERTGYTHVAFGTIVVALCIVFGACFWWNTRGTGSTRPSRTSVVLLVFQMAMALVFAESMFIVSAELPFMMPIREARKWLWAQCGLLLALTGAAVATRHFVPADSLLHTPWLIAVPGTVLYMLAWSCFAFGAGHLAVSETRNLQDLARIHSELLATQALLSDETRLAERLRISRELHDVVGHHLAGLSLNLQLASHLVEGPAVKPVTDAFLVAKLLLTEVREVVGGMRTLRQTDLRKAFELLCKGIREPCIHLEFTGDLEAMDPVSANVLFRCVQEAVTNVIKHASANNLWVGLSQSEAGWELSVRDDGKGCSTVKPGNGLKGMRERLEDVGGQLSMASTAGGGFALHALVHAPAAPL